MIDDPYKKLPFVIFCPVFPAPSGSTFTSTESQDLLELEKGLNDTMKYISRTRRIVCLQLARIKSEQLYSQANAKSFKQYLKMSRIKLPYSTAVEYAGIGEVWIKYQRQLDEIGFCETDGLKKLLFLEKAMKKHAADEVFQTLKKAGYHDFQVYSKNARAFSDESKQSRSEKKSTDEKTESGILTEGGKIYLNLKVPGKELLTFNMEYLNDPVTHNEYLNYMHKIKEVSMNFYKQ